ncbi:hypothetical protein Tco_1211842 [Tanacetum coccineum]
MGHQILRNVYEPLPLGGPPGQVTIQPQLFFNKDLECLLSGDKERKTALSISKLKAARYLDFSLEELVLYLWVESERDYDISAAYGITHWWFIKKGFYKHKHRKPLDHDAVRSLSFKDGDGDGDTQFHVQDGNTLQDDERLDLANDLMKAQVYN